MNGDITSSMMPANKTHLELARDLIMEWIGKGKQRLKIGRTDHADDPDIHK